MEARLADALQGNARLKAVIKLVRQAFAYDGYLENGVEDLAMGESKTRRRFFFFYKSSTENF